MTPFRAIFFDFGGVILRTEYQAPRQQLAERFRMDYEDLDRLVFNSESAKRAALGEIPEEEHWLNVVRRLKLPEAEAQAFQDAFFGGDLLDLALIQFIRELRGRGLRVGLISNAWSGLRAYLTRQKIADAFDSLTISAEVGAAKPAPKIFRLALQSAGARAEESLFVDDVYENIAGCEKIGMKGVLFKDPQKTTRDVKRALALN